MKVFAKFVRTSFCTACYRNKNSIIICVERPEVYIFARSQSSLKHQMLYTPYRVNDLKDLSACNSAAGQTYANEMRIGIGMS